MKRWAAFLLIASLFSIQKAGAAPQTTFLPSQLGSLFLKKTARGENFHLLYSKMSAEFQQRCSYAQFKEWAAERRTADLGSQLKLKLLRQEAFNSDAGVLYYVTEVNHPLLSFKKDFYTLERLEVQTENGEWKLKDFPARLMVGEMKERCTKDDYRVLYGLMEQDRARVLNAYSKKTAIQNSLKSAALFTQKKEFRNALVEYDKVLRLDADHPDAKAGLAFCRDQLAAQK